MTMSAASKISPGVSIDPGPGLEVGLVGKAAAGTGAFLHQHRVAVVDHHLHPCRGHAYAVLFRFDLF
jgi:hypothetical protein